SLMIYLRRCSRFQLFPSTSLFRSGRDDALGCLQSPPVARLAVHAGEHVVEAAQQVAAVVDEQQFVVTTDGVPSDPGHELGIRPEDRKSTRLNSSHVKISYAVLCSE